MKKAYMIQGAASTEITCELLSQGYDLDIEVHEVYM